MKQDEWEQASSKTVPSDKEVLCWNNALEKGKNYRCHTVIFKHPAYVLGLLSRTEKEKGSDFLCRC